MKARVIWKFEIPLHSFGVMMRDSFEVLMPDRAKILSVQLQNDKPVFWALVDPDEPRHDRFFRVIGTGHLVEDFPVDYVGSFQTAGGALVWHLFELRAPVPRRRDKEGRDEGS